MHTRKWPRRAHLSDSVVYVDRMHSLLTDVESVDEHDAAAPSSETALETDDTSKADQT